MPDILVSGRDIPAILSSLITYLNFHPLEVVFRYRDPQLQVGENLIVSSYYFNAIS